MLNASQTQWNPVCENIENPENKRADELYAEQTEKADFGSAAKGLQETLGYKPFVAPNTCSNKITPNVNFDDTTTPEEFQSIADASETPIPNNPDYAVDLSDQPISPTQIIQNNILTRYDPLGDPDKDENPLTNPEKRKENTLRAEALFFSPEKLSIQIASCGDQSPEKNAEANQDWLDANIGPDGPLKAGFERITGNVVIPKNIEGTNIGEICSHNTQDALKVHEALVDAFLLEIQTHTLKGRVNYPELQVQALIEDIQDPQTTPFEKLRAFGDIHSLVETGVAKGGAAQAKAFQKRFKLRAEKIAQQESEFRTHQTEVAQSQEERKEKTPKEDINTPEELDTGGEVFAKGEIDGINEAYNV